MVTSTLFFLKFFFLTIYLQDDHLHYLRPTFFISVFFRSLLGGLIVSNGEKVEVFTSYRGARQKLENQRRKEEVSWDNSHLDSQLNKVKSFFDLDANVFAFKHSMPAGWPVYVGKFS